MLWLRNELGICDTLRHCMVCQLSQLPLACLVGAAQPVLCRCGVQDVAFGDDAQHVAVLVS